MTDTQATIFIVDDTPANISVLDQFLVDHDFDVLIATDGESAIRKIERAQPDLCLLDVVMPGIDGFETCRRLKASPTTETIPIIFMTALADPLDKVKGLELGAVDYITKPFQQEEVLARINTHLKINQLQKQLAAQVKELELSQRYKDEFLANMSHELRTPLNVILMTAETLQAGVYGNLNPRQQAPIEKVKNSGEHLLQLINQILDLAKINAGKLELDVKAVSVEQICERTLTMIQPLASKKQLRVGTTLDFTVEEIVADELRLVQILLNLLTNAVKFTPEGGSIGLEIESDSQNNLAHFTVWDSGIGISAEDKAHLFKPFVQVNGRLNRTQEGTGLGLYLVFRLVELHGGQIHLESEVGRGSRFTLSLPWQPADKKKYDECAASQAMYYS